MASAPDDVRAFLAEHHRTVLITRRSGDLIQSSPVMATTDEEGHVVVSATEDRSKVLNVRRDPRVALCAFTDGFFGPWVQANGTAEIVSLPDAMDGLVDLYRRVAGEHEDWDDYRRAMAEERRVIIRITLDG